MRDRDVERITAFDHRFAKAQATDVIELPWGFAVRQSEFPLSQYNNRVVVTAAVPASDVLAAADDVLGGARLRHRYVSVDDDAVGLALRDELVVAGYEHQVIVTMIHDRMDVAPAEHEVREVSLETLRPALIRDWRAAAPDVTDEHLAQLADRTALYSRGAELMLIAVYEGDEVAAHADVYLDRKAGVAQFENLVTHADFRGRGYGRALVVYALDRGRQSGCDVSFLTADLDDWPREWYGRLGYVEAGRTHHFSRQG